MTTQDKQERNILDSIQAEVGKDTSTLLEFLTNHAQTIIAGIVLFIVIICGYWFYSSYAAKRTMTEQQEFSQVLEKATEQSKIADIQNYLKTAPKSTTATALITLAMEAQNAKNYEVALETWEKISQTLPEIKVEASLGMAQALTSMEQGKKAIETLEAILPKLDNLYIINVNSQIATIAENLGDAPRAITAYEALIEFAGKFTMPVDQEKVEFWKARVSALKTQAPKS